MENIDGFYCICEDCNVKDYCRIIDIENNECIYEGLDEYKNTPNFNKALKQKEVEFKRKRNYKKII